MSSYELTGKNGCYAFERNGLIHCGLRFFFFFLLSLFFPPSIVLPGTSTYIADLKEVAARRQLYDHRYWHILIHYMPTTGGWKSLVDDPEFFLAPDGDINPSAELAATIEAIFDESMSPPARCRFPARYEWLKETLPIDLAQLPESACPELDNVYHTIHPKTVALIFASGNINAPSSMFGHTFLRVDSIPDKPLLSHAVNYSAMVDRSDGFITFAFKGLFGYYPGYYSILPYYKKIREYTGMEQRDLWEYGLNLTEKEIRRMTLHILEMRDIYSDYYFLDENCSYDLLFLLEAARPSATLTARHKGLFITPIDTLRSVLFEGMIDNVVFRPSASRRIRNKVVNLSESEIGLVKMLASGEIKPSNIVEVHLPSLSKVLILDLAFDFMQYRFLKGEISREIYQVQHNGILKARGQIVGTSPEIAPIPTLPRPESGHLVSRVSLSGGARRGHPFLEIAYRPAYHSLDDPAEGFNEGSQIVLSDIAVRWYPRDEKVRIQKWDLMNIVSLAPRDALLRPASWKVQTGFMTREFPDRVESLVYAVNTGGGFTWNMSPLGIVYFFAETDLAVSGRYDRSFAFALGGAVGINRQVYNRWGVLAQIRYVYGVLGDTEQGRRFTGLLKFPFRLSKNQSLVLEGDHTEAPSVHTGTVRLSWNIYF